MELYQLKTFVCVAEQGNLTRAAERLFTSQPAVSAQIKALEDELNITLFKRTSRGMHLTPEGEQLCDQARHILASADSLKQHARALNNEILGEPHIGINTDFDFARIGNLYQKISTNYEQVRPHFMQSMSAEIQADIKNGKLDAGFYFGDTLHPEIHSIHLHDVPTAVVAPLAWKQQIDQASVEDLVQLPWIYNSENCPFTRVYEHLFEEAKQEPSQVVYADSEDAVRELLMSSAGVALLRLDDALKGEAREHICRWHGEMQSIKFRFGVHRHRLNDPLIKVLIEQVCALWQEEMESLIKQSA